MRDVADHGLRLVGRCGFTIRRVAFGAAIVVFAGDVADDLGPYKTILVGEELDSPDYGYRAEHLGGRTIVALGGRVDVVSASDREIGVLTNRGYERFADGRVTGAAFDDAGAYLVTYAGPAFALWDRAKRRRLVAMELGADIWHAMIAGHRLLLACSGGGAHVIDLRLVGA